MAAAKNLTQPDWDARVNANYEVYSLSELAGTYDPNQSGAIKTKRGTDDKTTLAKHLHEKPILITSSTFDIVKSMEPFAKLTNFAGDWGTIVGISGLAMAKMLKQENLEDEKLKQIVLNRLYVETPTSGVPTSPPADIFARQGAVWAFVHHAHALGLVKATRDQLEFPTMSDSIPTRYKAVVRFLEGLEGIEATDAFHFWKDILKFHGGVVSSKQEDIAAVIGLLKTPRTLIDTYILQQTPGPNENAHSMTTRAGIDDLFNKMVKRPTIEEILIGLTTKRGT
jgi:hypothetical protein